MLTHLHKHNPKPQTAHAALRREVQELNQQLSAARAAAAGAGAARDAVSKSLQAAERGRREAEARLDTAAAGGCCALDLQLGLPAV